MHEGLKGRKEQLQDDIVRHEQTVRSCNAKKVVEINITNVQLQPPHRASRAELLLLLHSLLTAT